jgi:hypothetical protein
MIRRHDSNVALGQRLHRRDAGVVAQDVGAAEARDRRAKLGDALEDATSPGDDDSRLLARQATRTAARARAGLR